MNQNIELYFDLLPNELIIIISRCLSLEDLEAFSSLYDSKFKDDFWRSMVLSTTQNNSFFKYIQKMYNIFMKPEMIQRNPVIIILLKWKFIYQNLSLLRKDFSIISINNPDTKSLIGLFFMHINIIIHYPYLGSLKFSTKNEFLHHMHKNYLREYNNYTLELDSYLKTGILSIKLNVSKLGTFYIYNCPELVYNLVTNENFEYDNSGYTHDTCRYKDVIEILSFLLKDLKYFKRYLEWLNTQQCLITQKGDVIKSLISLYDKYKKYKNVIEVLKKYKI